MSKPVISSPHVAVPCTYYFDELNIDNCHYCVSALAHYSWTGTYRASYQFTSDSFHTEILHNALRKKLTGRQFELASDIARSVKTVESPSPSQPQCAHTISISSIYLVIVSTVDLNTHTQREKTNFYTI